MTGEEEKALHNVMTTSALVFIAMAMLLFWTIASPSLSPVSAIADWDGDGRKNGDDMFPRNPDEWSDSDGDGVGDNGDAFPEDPDETDDSDSDGVGDNEDFYDEGDAALRISLDAFEFVNYQDDHVQTTYYPNAWFRVFVDLDGNGVYDTVYESEVFNATKSLNDFYELTLDVYDGIESVRFMIVAYDVTSVSTNEVTDYEIIDYNPDPGLKTVVNTIEMPCERSWAWDGVGDDDTPDCTLEYTVETVEMH